MRLTATQGFMFVQNGWPNTHFINIYGWYLRAPGFHQTSRDFRVARALAGSCAHLARVFLGCRHMCVCLCVFCCFVRMRRCCRQHAVSSVSTRQQREEDQRLEWSAACVHALGMIKNTCYRKIQDNTGHDICTHVLLCSPN